MKDPGQRIGPYLRALREARGLSQEKLAERCGLARDTVRNVENGICPPTLSTLRRLCAGLGMRLSEFFEGLEAGE